MPFIIAGFVYLVFVAAAMAAVGVVCLMQRRPPGRAVIGGAIGSLIGFLPGLVAGLLVGISLTAIGMNVGASVTVTAVSLGAAILGTILGVSMSRPQPAGGA